MCTCKHREDYFGLNPNDVEIFKDGKNIIGLKHSTGASVVHDKNIHGKIGHNIVSFSTLKMMRELAIKVGLPPQSHDLLE